MTESKLISFEELFKKSGELFSRGMTLFLTIQLIVFGAAFVAVFLFVILVFLGTMLIPLGISFTALFSNESNSFLSVGITIIGILLVSLSMILFFVLLFGTLVIGQIALILAIDDVYKGRPLDYKQYFKIAWKKFWPALALFLLCGLIVGAGLMFFFIPGIILGFFLIFSFYIFVLENKKVTDSISLSFKMVKNNFWDVVVRYLIVYLFFVAVAIFGNFIPFVNIIVNVFLGIFVAIYIYLLYKDIRIKNNIKL